MKRAKVRPVVDFTVPAKFEGLYHPSRSRTKQEFKKECDISFIMKRYESTGELPHFIKEGGVSGDFSEAPDFQAAMDIVAEANLQFSLLSANVRERFHNDPREFLEFANNANNADEMVKMGLMKPEAVERVKIEREALHRKTIDDEVAKRLDEKTKSSDKK